MAISHAHLILLLIISLFLLPTLRAISYRDCSDRSSPIQVASVDIIQVKDRESFQISGSTSKNITGGDIRVEVKLGLIRILRRQYDLCELMACPVAPGAFVLPFDNIFPWRSIAKFTVHIDIFEKSEDEDQIVCLTFDFQPKNSVVVSV